MTSEVKAGMKVDLLIYWMEILTEKQMFHKTLFLVKEQWFAVPAFSSVPAVEVEDTTYANNHFKVWCNQMGTVFAESWTAVIMHFGMKTIFSLINLKIQNLHTKKLLVIFFGIIFFFSSLFVMLKLSRRHLYKNCFHLIASHCRNT